MYNRTEIYFTNHRFFKLLLLKNVFPRIPRYYRLIYARVGEKEAWRILLIIFSICIIIVAVQWWWWWCSRDSDSSRWIELFALLKIVEERRRSWWGWWLNLLSSYSGSSVSRWRRLRSKAPPPLFLSPPVTLHVFSLFLFLFLLLSLGAQQVQPTRAARGINVGPKGPRIFMSRQREPRPWLCAAGGLSSPRSNVRNFCFLNSWIEAKADRHFLIRILLLFCIFCIRDRSLVFPFSFPCIILIIRVVLIYFTKRTIKVCCNVLSYFSRRNAVENIASSDSVRKSFEFVLGGKPRKTRESRVEDGCAVCRLEEKTCTFVRKSRESAPPSVATIERT